MVLLLTISILITISSIIQQNTLLKLPKLLEVSQFLPMKNSSKNVLNLLRHNCWPASELTCLRSMITLRNVGCNLQV